MMITLCCGRPYHWRKVRCLTLAPLCDMSQRFEFSATTEMREKTATKGENLGKMRTSSVRFHHNAVVRRQHAAFDKQQNNTRD